MGCGIMIKSKIKLLDFNFCACSNEVSFDLFSVFLGNAFLNSLGAFFNESLSFLEAETGNFANCLDNRELAGTEGSEDNVEFSLFFNNGSCCATNCCYCNRSCGYAEFCFENFNEVCYLENGKSFDFFNNSCDFFR